MPAINLRRPLTFLDYFLVEQQMGDASSKVGQYTQRSTMSCDSRGVRRGRCILNCLCDAYDGGNELKKCHKCGHPPGKHENVDAQSTTKPAPAVVKVQDVNTSRTAKHPTVAALDGFVASGPAALSMQCAVPGCGRPVDFNLDTGLEYDFCAQHRAGGAANFAQLPSQSASMQVQDVEMDDQGFGGNTLPVLGDQQDPSVASTATMFNTFNPFFQLPPGTTKCAIPECPNAAYVDENGGVHKCCSRSHAREFEARATAVAVSQPPPPPPPPNSSLPISSALPPDKKCAIQECPNPRYVDESGTVHECCGITHAMEHQRRLALMKQTNQQVVKGVTHCYLPECNKPTWPFMNYCGRTHADLGKQRNLPPPPSLTSGPAAGTGVAAAQKTSSMCLIPECTAPKYVDPNSGVTHDFCGKSHADEGKKRGIRPQAEKVEEQCDLPGCTNKKRSEGTTVFDYCCRDHATQDAPNRAARALTSHSEVQKFLNQFSNLKVVSLTENDHAKPGGQLFNRFKSAYDGLPKHHRKTCLAFHGTAESNIQSICSKGYDPKLRRGQAYGAGEYFAVKPDIPLSYCQGGKKMLLNELLLGQAGVHHTQHGDIVVMKNPDHDLPRYVITFR